MQSLHLIQTDHYGLRIMRSNYLTVRVRPSKTYYLDAIFH